MHALIEYILMSKLIAAHALNCYARAGQSMYI